MNTQTPTTPHVARPPRRRATSLMPSVVGTAAGLCREMVGRHLSFSEPERLLLKGCSLAAFATALTITGGIGMMVSAVTLPVIPTAALLLAATAIAGIFETCSELAEYERYSQEAFALVADDLAVEQERRAVHTARLKAEIAELRRDPGMTEEWLLRRIHAAGDLEGTSARSGAAAGNEQDRKQPFPAAEAPNVLRPQFPDFRRQQ